MQAFSKRFLLISLLLPFQAIFADVSTPQTSVSVQDKSHPVYLSADFREAICKVRNASHKWSQRFVEFCDSVANKRVAARYEEAEAILEECLAACKNCPDLQDVETAVRQYEAHLRNGEANLILIDEDGVATRGCSRKFKKGRAYCSLLTRDLRVCGPTVLDSLRVLGASIFDGSVTFNDSVTFGGDVTIGGTVITAGNPITNFGFFSSITTQAVADGDPVTFSLANANNVGVTLTAGTDLTVSTAGLYLVQFSTTSGTVATGQQFGLRINDTSEPRTIYGTGGIVAITGTQNTGFAFVRLVPTDILTLNNESGVLITLTANIGGTDTNNTAAISVVRIAP